MVIPFSGTKGDSMESRTISLIFLLISCIGVYGQKFSGLDDPVISEWLSEQRNHKRARAEPTFVTIQNGTLEGTTYFAMGGDTVFAYLGIPFAKPPVGDLRFEPPVPFDDSWETPRPAYSHPNACPQTLTNTTTASEDCLYVSVYTKRNSSETGGPLLPVMYFIHGGGFLLGQTSYYTASKLLLNNVVLVTVQYRMGPFGFLSTQDEVVPGNMGMKDMVQGLRWVKDNVEAFGGDPNRVTVFGESAGGAAATFMLISPLAKGLFSSIAAMSGTALAEWSMDREPIRSTGRLAERLNCTGDNRAVVDCMKGLDWPLISAAHLDIMLNTQAGELKANIAGSSPTLEPPHDGAFLPDEPLKLLETGEIQEVPVLIGANQHEGSFLLGIAYALRLGWNNTLDDPVYVHDKLIGDLLATWGVYEDTNGASVSQAFAAGFIPVDNPRTNFTTFTYELIDLFSVLFMKAPILRTAEILSRRVPEVYFYSFEYAGRNSLWNVLDLVPILIPDLAPLLPPFKGGITHGDDLLYMFTLPMFPNQVDLAVSRQYCTYFTDFATNGKPSASWPKFTVNEPNYMQIKAEPMLKQHYPGAWKQGLLSP